MTLHSFDTAERIVSAIVSDLTGRKGLGDEWDQIDPDIVDEIQSKWVELARGEIRADGPRI